MPPQTFFMALMAILMPIVNASRHRFTDRSVRQPVVWAGATVVAWKAAYSAVLASGLSLGVHVWLRRGALLRPRSPRRGTPSGSARIAA